MRTVILTPWRSDNGERAKIYTVVRTQQETLDIPIFVADTTEEPFNICGAWNAAARAAGEWDTAIFWGADFTLEDPASAVEAVAQAENGYPLVFAFDKATKMTRRETALIRAGIPAPKREDTLPFGGIRAVTREAWDLVGGYDERFKGWGHGDRAFMHVLTTIGVEPARVPGRLIMHRHLGRAHHPEDPYYQHQEANLALLREYTDPESE